jgi:DnaJ like chaperone protein
MALLGKIVGGIGGLALGGPLGALVGAFAGHAFDTLTAEPPPERVDDPTRKIAFTIGTIVLGAKMAKADGVVTRDEVAAFRQVFRVAPEEVGNVKRVFDIAKRDARGYEPYARQLAQLLRHRPEVLEQLLDCLFFIAKADGHIDSAELDYLRDVARLFGFDEAAFERIRLTQLGPEKSAPYQILGVEHDINEAGLKQAYLNLVRRYHPDTMIAEGLPEEAVKIANEKMAAINAAHDTIRRLKGFG